MNTLRSILIGAIVIYGGLLALMYLFQRSLLYFPDAARTAPAAAGLARAEEVILTSSDDEKLIAWYVPPRDGKPVVVYFQGNAGASNLRINRFTWLTADGTGLLALSYRGYGGSTGTPTEQGLILDGQAAYDFVRSRYDAGRIVLFGESLGTAVATALAVERDIAGLILDAPFTSAADVGAAVYPFAPVRWLMKDSWRTDQRIARVSAPLLVLHGGRDGIVPISFGERLFALASEPKKFVHFPDGGHGDLDDHGAAKVVREFLAALR